MTETSQDLLRELLAAVSRSFYLTVRVLPAAVRRPIGLAYLLARATDTIADTGVIPVERRLAALAALDRAIQEGGAAPPELAELAEGQSLPAERTLLVRIGEALALLAAAEPADRARIRRVLEIITSGQTLDLRRFGGASAEAPVALATDAELDDYTYRVAGCVGEFWTDLCRARLFPDAPLDEALLRERAVRFGKVLQWVNILRDLPRDLATGRCYLPRERLEPLGLTPSALRDPAVMPRLLPLYGEYLDVAQAHLAAGWSYTNMLPRRQVRVRLACAWPVLFGARTLARLRTANALDPARRVKISRREVKALMLQTVLRYPWPTAWQRLFDRARI
jgi:farnesyl-diphosphate farnesyltransferase